MRGTSVARRTSYVGAEWSRVGRRTSYVVSVTIGFLFLTISDLRHATFANADEPSLGVVVSTSGVEQQRYVSRVQPLLVEAMLIVRQPVGDGRDRAPDQQGQLAALGGVLERAEAVEPPTPVVQVHRLIVRGLQRLRSALRLQLDGAGEQAERAMAEGQQLLTEATMGLQGVALSVSTAVDGTGGGSE